MKYWKPAKQILGNNNNSGIPRPINYSNVERRLDSNGLHGKNEEQKIHITSTFRVLIILST